MVFAAIHIIQAQAIKQGNSYLPTIFAQSPNAGSLGTYGDIPVSLFNGVPNININLYNLKVDNFEMPISLSYHLANVKPEERPGWVGLGWNLNAGGVITRNIVGKPDEIMDPQNSSNHTAISYYNNYGILSGSNWKSLTMMQGYSICVPALDCPYPGPDEFSFNVNGISGSFYKNYEGEWVVSANQNIDLKITDELKSDFKLYDVGYPINPNHSPRNYTIKRIIYGFTLTTDDGTQYIFGKTPQSVEFSASTTSGTSDPYSNRFVAKAWHLTKIILPSNKEIVFSYNALDGDLNEYPANQQNNRAVFKQYVSTSSMGYQIGGVGSSTSTNDYKILSRSYVTYLESISTENTNIYFSKSLANDLEYDFSGNLAPTQWAQYTNNNDYDPGNNLGGLYMANKHWYKLDQMVVTRPGTNFVVYRADFNYLENPTKRLKLIGLEESGKTYNNIVKRHFFEYNPQSLPNYNSKKIDHWGYPNNGMGVNDDGVPTTGYSYHMTRQPNPNYMQAEILTKIEFPTGGYTNFEYENHTFSQVVEKASLGGGQVTFGLIPAASSNEIAGGLRVKKITTDPLYSGTPIVKEYFYVKDYTNGNMGTSGILAGRPIYYEYGNTPNYQFMRMSSDSFSTVNDTRGSHVTYSKVVEKLSDGSYTEFTYSNHDNGYIDHPAYLALYDDQGTGWIDTMVKKLPFNSVAAERGNVLFEKKYNTQNQLVEQTKNFYDDNPGRFTDKIRSVFFSVDQYGEVVQNGPFTEVGTLITVYKMAAFANYSNHVFLKKKEHTLYDIANNTSLLTTTDFTYNSQPNHHHLRSTKNTTNNATGNYLETKYFYPGDNEMSSQPYVSNLVTKNIVGKPLQTQTFRNTEKLSEQTTQYFPFPSSDPTRPLLLPEFIFSKIGNIPGGLPEKKVTFKYDTVGNIIQYTQEDGVPVSVVWGYSKTLPVAKLENIEYSNIPSNLITAVQSASNGTSEAALITELDNLRTQLPATMVTTYTYQSLIGISTITDVKGNLTTYTYDDFGRLKWVKDKNGKILSENQYHYKNQ